MSIKDKNRDVTGYNDFLIHKDQWLKKAKTKEKAKVEAIQKGFVETVVVFIDMADSTKFKIKYKNQPQKWINKMYQFSSIVKTYAEGCNGIPVKYIGDEVMVVFKGKSKIKDTLNLLMRINDLEKDISTFTKSKTQVKVSVDFGNVYNLSYEGHDEPDPQGTPIDRCARIAKLCKPSTILTSVEFRNKCDHTQLWFSLGRINLKGIGMTEIFQYGAKTFNLEEEPATETKAYFHIFNKASGKVINAPNSSKEDDELLNLMTLKKGENQIWEFCRQEDNFYSIINKHSEKCLEVKDKSKGNSVSIQQSSFKNAPNQLWKIEANNDGSYCLKAKHSESFLEQDALTVPNETERLIQHQFWPVDRFGTEGNALVIFSEKSTDHQRWILKPINLDEALGHQ